MSVVDNSFIFYTPCLHNAAPRGHC